MTAADLRIIEASPSGGPVSQPRRVVHVIGALIAGGAERFVAELAQQLRVRSFHVAVWALSSRTDEVGREMRRALTASGVEIATGPQLRVRWSTILWYRDLLRLTSPAVVHLHTPNTEMVHAAASVLIGGDDRFGGRLYRTIHSIKRPNGPLPRLAYIINHNATSIAVSRAAAETHRPMINAPIFTITNGVAFTEPVRNLARSQAAKQELGLSPAVRHFLHLGRMSGDSIATAPKAHDVLIEAWRRSALGRAGHMLHLLGDGPLREQLGRCAHGDASIVFHGIRADVPRWLAAADALLFPSRIEGLPLAAIEAVGAGLPCMLADIEPLRELNPPASMYVPVDDIDAWAQAIRVFDPGFVDPELTLEFRARFSIEAAADNYTLCYQPGSA
jgi:glycosyltransferase involved in cell wall biosynthesis